MARELNRKGVVLTTKDCSLIRNEMKSRRMTIKSLALEIKECPDKLKDFLGSQKKCPDIVDKIAEYFGWVIEAVIKK